MTLNDADRALLDAALRNEHFQRISNLLLEDFKTEFITRMRYHAQKGDITGVVGNNAVVIFCEDILADLRARAAQPGRATGVTQGSE